MNERAIYGLRKNGKDKCTYNQKQGYPKGLGTSMIRFIQNRTIEELTTLYDNIILVDEFDKPTKSQMKKLEKLGLCSADKVIISDFWFWILQDFQGGLDKYNKYSEEYGMIYMMNHIAFIKDSAFCQYGYIINLDNSVFEFWIGNQTEKPKQNRYGRNPDTNSGYYPCKLALEIPLNEIKSDTLDNIVQKLTDSLKSTHEQKGTTK